MKRPAAALALPALLLGLGLLSRSLGVRAFDAFVHYETPFPGVLAGPAEGALPAPAPPLSDHVVLVLLDGLGLAPSRPLPFLGELRARGADYDCRVGVPSFSLPARATMLSGAWADVHGQASNYNVRSLGVDHLFAVARRHGRSTALASGPKPQVLFSPHLERALPLGEEAETAPLATYEAALARHERTAAALLAQATSGLVMLELYVVDEAGHGWGAGSAEYGRATRLADDALRRLAGALDLGRTTLVVAGDHGHVREGGHGGSEPDVVRVPLVMAGAGVRAGAHGRCEQVDLAPTLSVLLGLPLPAASQGRLLLDGLALERDARVAWLRAALAQRVAFAGAYARRLAELEPRHPVAVSVSGVTDDGLGEDALRARLAALGGMLARLRDERLDLERRQRRPVAVLMVLVPLGVLGFLFGTRILGGRELAWGFAAAALGVAVYHALLPALGLRASLTAVNKDEWLAAFFRRDMALGLGCAAVAAAGAATWRWRRAREGGWAPARLAWTTAAAFAWLLLVKVALAYWLEPVVARWHLPDQSRAFGFYLDVLALTAVAFGGVLFGPLAWAAATAASRRR